MVLPNGQTINMRDAMGGSKAARTRTQLDNRDKTMAHNLFDTLQELQARLRRYGQFYSLPALEQAGVGKISRLPVSIRIVLESGAAQLRRQEGHRGARARARRTGQPTAPRTDEIPFVVARVVLQDFTGVPLLVDLAAMRTVAAEHGQEPEDRSSRWCRSTSSSTTRCMIDYYGRPNALDLNMKLEFKRNERALPVPEVGHAGVRHVQGRAARHRHRPPGQPRVPRARRAQAKDGVYYPDTLVGTDSHTTMINGIGVVGWGVGGIEAEAGMLGQPVYFLTPDVVGVELKGTLREGVTATDLVLTVTEMLRKAKVVGKFVEFFGEGAASLSVPDRATIANMAPEYGATMGFFPVDDDDDRLPARHRPHRRARSTRFEAYFKAQGLFGMPKAGEIDYTQDARARPRRRHAVARRAEAPAGPHRARRARSAVRRALQQAGSENGFTQPPASSQAPSTTPMIAGAAPSATRSSSRHAAACRATSSRWSTTGRRPIAFASRDAEARRHRQRRRADRRDHLVHEHLEPERAARRRPAGEEGGRARPHGQAAHQDLARAGLARGHRVPDARPACCPTSSKLGFDVAAYGCTTCIGNAGDLAPEINDAIIENDLVCAAVLSGNRNFEARIHPNLKANFLAVAAARRRLRDRRHGADAT